VLLGKKDVPDVLAQIERLGAAGIDVHTQVVACPGLNDGAALQQTIYELAARYPVVQSISVVPVGLTRFRFNGKAPQSIRTAIEVHETPEWINTNWERQPLWSENAAESGTDWGFCSRLGVATDVPLRCYEPDEAARLIDSVLPFRTRYEAELGLSLVYPSDEFYLLCGRDLPAAAFYDDFPQYSNGVGMTRDFLDEWAAARRRLPARMVQPLRLALVCGTLIAPTMEQVVARLNRIAGLEVRLLPVVNAFFGETVTVSGLLMAQDVIPALRESGCDHAVLPRVMFDHQGTQTLDGLSPQHIAEESHVPVTVADGAAELARHIQHLARVGLSAASVAA
jgi:NifB/MoaA-like Fe-S oxidoreductase